VHIGHPVAESSNPSSTVPAARAELAKFQAAGGGDYGLCLGNLDGWVGAAGWVNPLPASVDRRSSPAPAHASVTALGRVWSRDRACCTPALLPRRAVPAAMADADRRHIWPTPAVRMLTRM
jgi:hypothetical protein